MVSLVYISTGFINKLLVSQRCALSLSTLVNIVATLHFALNCLCNTICFRLCDYCADHFHFSICNYYVIEMLGYAPGCMRKLCRHIICHNNKLLADIDSLI